MALLAAARVAPARVARTLRNAKIAPASHCRRSGKWHICVKSLGLLRRQPAPVFVPSWQRREAAHHAPEDALLLSLRPLLVAMLTAEYEPPSWLQSGLSGILSDPRSESVDMPALRRAMDELEWGAPQEEALPSAARLSQDDIDRHLVAGAFDCLATRHIERRHPGLIASLFRAKCRGSDFDVRISEALGIDPEDFVLEMFDRVSQDFDLGISEALGIDPNDFSPEMFDRVSQDFGPDIQADEVASAAKEDAAARTGHYPNFEAAPECRDPRDDVLLDQLRGRQRFWAAVVSGVLAGLLCGALWGLLIGVSGLHIELACLPMIGVGLLVGKAIALFGRGVDPRFAWWGAGIAALTSIAGYLFSALVTVELQLRFHGDIAMLFSRIEPMGRLFLANLGWADGVCFGIAVYEGYRFSRLPITETSLQGLQARWSPTLIAVLLLVCPMFVGLMWLSLSGTAIEALAVTGAGRLAVLKRGPARSGEVELWDLPGRTLVARFGQDESSLGVMSMSAGGNTLATVNDKAKGAGQRRQGCGSIRLWDAATGQLQRELSQEISTLSKVLLPPDGTCLLVNHARQLVEVWTPAGRPVAVLSHDAGVLSMTVSADAAMLVTAAGDEIHLWDLRTRTERGAIAAGPGPIGTLALSPNGKSLAAVFPLDQAVILFNVATGKQTAALDSDQDWLSVAAYSPDGRTLAVGGGSFHRTGKVEVWDLDAQRKTRELAIDTNTVRCVAFSADGKEIIAGSNQSCHLTDAFCDGNVHRWNAATGEALPSPGD